MKQTGSTPASGKKVANGLVAMSCAAVLSVYAAGYVRTRSAADRLEAQSVERRAAAPDAPRTEIAVAEIRPQAIVAPAPVSAPTAAAPPVRDAWTHDKDYRFVPSPEPAPAEVPAPSLEPPAPSLSETPAPLSLAAPVAAAPPITAPVIRAPVIAPPPVPKAAVAAVAPPPTPAQPKWKDGTYYGWGTSRHGDIQAEVVIAGGRISATISQCRTRYPCSVIEILPPQVAQRQSPEVDYISRATQSTNAFYYAVVEALNKAK